MRDLEPKVLLVQPPSSTPRSRQPPWPASPKTTSSSSRTSPPRLETASRTGGPCLARLRRVSATASPNCLLKSRGQQSRRSISAQVQQACPRACASRTRTSSPTSNKASSCSTPRQQHPTTYDDQSNKMHHHVPRRSGPLRSDMWACCRSTTPLASRGSCSLPSASATPCTSCRRSTTSPSWPSSRGTRSPCCRSRRPCWLCCAKVNVLQVAPAELEKLLLENEHISDAAVVGITM